MTAPALQPAPDRLIVFTRLPRPGRVKTRLIPALGPGGAVEVHDALTRRTLASARRLALRREGGRPLDLEVRFTGAEGGAESGAPAARAWLGDGPLYRDQGPGDLGERMERAMSEALGEGAERAVLVGADCPLLGPDILERAFALLEERKAVLGPAEDGGYYLLGLGAPRPELFRGIDWGTGRVLRQSLAAARISGLEPELLPPLWDLDRPEDLPRWRALLEEEKGRVAVVIPALEEEGRVGRAVASAFMTGAVEVIVADGGSRDATREEARRAGALVLLAPRGRARQMNAGARLTSLPLLLFLHADCQAPRDAADEIRRILGKRDVAAGAFRFRLDHRPAGLRFIELCVALRCRLAGLAYGDQGFFLTAPLFWRLGGFPELAIMEDWEMIRASARVGRVEISPLHLISSARRWRDIGVFRTTLINYLVPVLYGLGVEPMRLRKFYDRASRDRSQGNTSE